ncbi:CRISPR-associated endonuclease Cas2 [Prodigiosinella confusarubida]|nr:CRISPR-associated endonuclease Cas2 [Serratia sp. ATCC 39006]
MSKPLWLIGYDITCPKRLRKMQRRCASQGWALQKSLFLFALTVPERQALCRELQRLINPEEDRLLCLPFDTPSGSFHLGPRSDYLLIHSDPRLNDFVF